MYVMKIKEKAYVDYELEVEIDDEDYYDFMNGTKTEDDLKSNYEEEILDAREENDLNEWDCSYGEEGVEIIEE